MKRTTKSLSQRLMTAIASRQFLWVIIGLLVFEASWIALSGRYPMAFDEDFHLGVIRLYAHHLSPFWASQPDGANMFGAVVRDPSFLYHYIMSFPYRLLAVITDNQSAQVIVLRFINIGLFGLGIYLYRNLLLKAGVSRAISHLCMLVVVLLPITPLLAAQINYDNLFLPLTAAALLLTVAASDNFAASKKSINIKTVGLLLAVCLVSSLVKYAFLPIFVAITGFLLVRLWQSYGSINSVIKAAAAGLKDLGAWSLGALAAALTVLIVLCIQRYGVNLVRYHTPVPDCGQVLSVEQCSEYGPWIRDYTLKQNKTEVSHGPIEFTHEWLYGMWLRTFFAVDGPSTGFQTRGPLLVPGIGAIVLASLSGLVLLLTAVRIFKKYKTPVVWLFAVVTLSLVCALWLDGFEAFTRTGKAVAINGRYLLPVMPLILFFGVAAWNELLAGRRVLKLALASISILTLAWGGGSLTYILRSNDAWYWSNSFVRTANHAVQDSVGPITPGYERRTQFLH